MSLRPIAARSRDLLLKSEPCFSCQAHQLLRPVFRHALRPTASITTSDHTSTQGRHWSRNYASGTRMSPEQVRAEIDTRNRHAFFKTSRGLLAVDALTAENMIDDVLLPRAKSQELDVVALAKKYKRVEPRLDVEDVAALAIVTYRIPDVQDVVRKSRMPPSIHKPTAGLMLTACSKAKDPLAILFILSRVLQSSTHHNPKIRRISKEFTTFFQPAHLAYCRAELEELSSRGDVDAMNLLGQFLEKEGKIARARELYEKALEKADTKPNPKSPRTIFLTIPPVWNILGNLLLASKDPKSRTQAKAVFEKGALKADDPLSYYHLASFEDEKSANWLKYMSKAAATGHAEAMYKLGRFYLNASSYGKGSAKALILKDRRLVTPLKWLTWQQGSLQDLAEEWLGVAAGCGHKPASLELAELHETNGDSEKAKRILRGMIEPPPADEMEEWPRLVEEARRKLST